MFFTPLEVFDCINTTLCRFIIWKGEASLVALDAMLEEIFGLKSSPHMNNDKELQFCDYSILVEELVHNNREGGGITCVE